jgi:hypothetical protein
MIKKVAGISNCLWNHLLYARFPLFFLEVMYSFVNETIGTHLRLKIGQNLVG